MMRICAAVLLDTGLNGYRLTFEGVFCYFSEHLIMLVVLGKNTELNHLGRDEFEKFG